jgi:hypothetical protein
MPSLQPLEIIRALERHKVAYVLIGGMAAVLHGSPVFTNDADICPDGSRKNLERLAAALVEMHARIFSIDHPEDGLVFDCSPKFFERMQMVNLVTNFGRVDISFEPSGTQGYKDLRRAAVIYDLEGLKVPAASLADVIRSKEAAARAKDRQTLPLLRELLDNTETDAGDST